MLRIIEAALLASLAGGVWFAVWSRWRENRREYVRAFTRRLIGDRYDEPYYEFPVDRLIREAELETGVRLTWHARQLILLPLLESYERGEYIEISEIDRSIKDVVRTAAAEPAPDEVQAKSRGSKSVIRAFHRRFCNIPPFCSRRDKENVG